MHDLAPSKASIRGRNHPTAMQAVGVDHATTATSKATVPYSVARIGTGLIEPVEKANANKLAELHFGSPESARRRHNAPLTQITQVQYWPRGGAGSTLVAVGRS